jgi:TPP-dependent indolepyruvate ferredoxin oxidoreductase alpha subunit
MERKRRTINKRGRRAEQKERARASDEHRKGGDRVRTKPQLQREEKKKRERERERAFVAIIDYIWNTREKKKKEIILHGLAYVVVKEQVVQSMTSFIINLLI